MTKQDVEALATLGRAELLARGLSGEQADALLALDPAERRRLLLEEYWDAAPTSGGESTLHKSKRATDNVGSVQRQRRKYPYKAAGLMGTPAARDCPHVPTTMGKQRRRTVMVPVVTSRRHEAELMARHGLARE